MLIAEEYLLLVLDDRGRSWVTSRELGVAGALLCELAAREKVMLDERGRLRVQDSTSTGDELLDEAVLRVGAKAGKKPKDALASIGKGMPKSLLQRLSTAEVVREERSGPLGLPMWSRWPMVTTAPRDALRTELLRVLGGEQQPDSRTGSLVSLLDATSAWGTALPKDVRQGRRTREIRASAKQIAKGRWGSEAVSKAIADIAAAAGVATAAYVASTG